MSWANGHCIVRIAQQPFGLSFSKPCADREQPFDELRASGFIFSNANPVSVTARRKQLQVALLRAGLDRAALFEQQQAAQCEIEGAVAVVCQ